MSKYDRLKGEQAIPFDEAESGTTPKRSRGTKPPGKPGPAPDPDSLTAQREDGRGPHLHVVIPAEIHDRLHIRRVMTKATVSDMVAEAVAEYLEKRKARRAPDTPRAKHPESGTGLVCFSVERLALT